MSEAGTGVNPENQAENSSNRKNSIANGKNVTAMNNEEPTGLVAEPPLININKGYLKRLKD